MNHIRLIEAECRGLWAKPSARAFAYGRAALRLAGFAASIAFAGDE